MIWLRVTETAENTTTDGEELEGKRCGSTLKEDCKALTSLVLAGHVIPSPLTPISLQMLMKRTTGPH